MQKKSFLIKDILLQKLNEDDSLKKLNQQNCSEFANSLNEKQEGLDKNLKKAHMIDSNQLLYDWHSLAMATMTQNNALINTKNVFNWNKFNFLNQANIPEEFGYINGQFKLKNYFPFNTLTAASPNNIQSSLINQQKRKFDYLLEDVEIDENSSSSSLCESSKFSDCESNVDVRSETSSIISIENTEDVTNDLQKNQDKKGVQNSKKDEKRKRKNRRNRTVFTELQLMGLERRFDSAKYLSTPDRAELANALGLSQLQVKTWYQNRRMKWKKQVMQSGCLVAPTKPKGRPKKGTIPSLGLTFDTSSLLSAMESRKNSTNHIGKEINSKMNNNLFLGRKNANSNDLGLVNIAGMSHMNSVSSTMNPIIKAKDVSGVSTNSQTTHFIQNDFNQQLFNGKIDSLATKKPKLLVF